MVNRTRVEGGGYSKHDIITSVEVLVFMFTGGVKFYTSVVFQKKKNSSCSGLSYLFLVSLHVVGVESEYFVYTRYHTYVCEMNLVCAYHIIVYPVQHVCLS